MYLCGIVPVFKTQIKYLLDKAPNALVLQVKEQSPDVTTFLNNHNFMASNGLRIATSKYPEFKHSTNVLFLRGKDTSNDLKLDVTRFVGKMQRDNAYDMVTSAVQELVNFVKKAGQAYEVSSANRFYPDWGVKTTSPRDRNSYDGSNTIIVSK